MPHHRASQLHPYPSRDGHPHSPKALAVEPEPEPERPAVAVMIAGDIPRTMLPRQTFFGCFLVVNRGSETLSPSASGGYALAYRWLEASGETFAEGPRSTLP